MRNLVSYELHYQDGTVMKGNLDRGPEEVPEVLTIPPFTQLFITSGLEPRLFQLGGKFDLIPGRRPEKPGCVAVYRQRGDHDLRVTPPPTSPLR